MVALIDVRAWLPVLATAGLLACSPEARRTRDGGPGADPGNKRVAVHLQPDPRAADTSLWPGRAEAPADRMARGDMPAPTVAPPVLPRGPATGSQQRTFDRGRRADPNRQGSTRE